MGTHVHAGKVALFQYFTSDTDDLMIFVPSGLFVSYTLRVNISVAAASMSAEFGWSEDQKGLVLVSIIDLK